MPKGTHPQIADSVLVPQQNDTIVALPYGQDSAMIGLPDTLSAPVFVQKDSVQPTPAAGTYTRYERKTETAVTDTALAFQYETGWNSGRNFLMDNPLSDIKVYEKKDNQMLFSVQEKPVNMESVVVKRRIDQGDWLTGLGLLILVLFIWIRIFYGKFYGQLADSITNYQISAKLYLEKNILTRRVSLALDLVYFIVFAVFIYELVSYTGILRPHIYSYALYGMILGILLAFSVARIAILRLTGFVFQKGSVFAEYIHHTYIYNKGLGMVLFPIVILLVYIPPGLTLYVLAAGLAIYVIAFIFKVIRAYKIIIRKDVLLFYMILYLCTLEILPLLLGYKVMKSLILSY